MSELTDAEIELNAIAMYGDRGNARGLREQIRAILAAHEAKGVRPDAKDRFCDSHCTWRDHHPDCPRADGVNACPAPRYKVRKESNESMALSGTEAWGQVWSVVNDPGQGEAAEQWVGFFINETTANTIAAMLNAGVPVDAPDLWAIFDSQGYYEAVESEETAQSFCERYNARKLDPLQPYSYRRYVAAGVNPSSNDQQKGGA